MMATGDIRILQNEIKNLLGWVKKIDKKSDENYNKLADKIQCVEDRVRHQNSRIYKNEKSVALLQKDIDHETEYHESVSKKREFMERLRIDRGTLIAMVAIPILVFLMQIIKEKWF